MPSLEKLAEERLIKLLTEAQARFFESFRSEAVMKVDVKLEEGLSLRFSPNRSSPNQGFNIVYPNGAYSSLFSVNNNLYVRTMAAQKVEALWNACQEAEVRSTGPAQEAIRQLEEFLGPVEGEPNPLKPA